MYYFFLSKISNELIYKRNYNVKIRLLSFELASYFLNSAKHITLLESDAELISLVDPNDPLANGDSETVQQLRKDMDVLNEEPYY